MIDFEMKSIPDSSFMIGDAQQLNRFRHYRRFIWGNTVPPVWLSYPVLDVGGKNYIGHRLCDNADNTFPSDFNEEIFTPKGFYQDVLCFEVLEHVCNPLHFLKMIRSRLRKDGTLWISTPAAGWINLFHSEHHVTEYKPYVTIELLRRAGFEVKRYKIFRHIPWWNMWRMFTGFRPFFKWPVKWFLLKIIVLECQLSH